MPRGKRRLSSPQIVILGFAAVILLGSLLLMLPFATRDGRSAPFSDALFTAASAACVTGLVVQDTATYWSGFGQGVILALIQVGGMGVVTFAVVIASAAGQRISLKQRGLMQDSISAHQLDGIVKLTGFIVGTTAALELTGAAVLAPVFCREFGLWRGIWYGLFHAVSAFCNAGFDLMGVRAPYSSLTSFVSHPVVNLAVMSLIIIGGIGFLTWDDLRVNRLRLRRYRMQTKVVLSASALLLAVPAVYFFFFEFQRLEPAERLWGSLFQSVTARTAGFNTIDFNELSEGGVGIMIVLMLTGGSPGSTAGGMKVTTLAVMVSTALAIFRRQGDTHFFGRRIDEDTVRNAMAILTLYLALFFGGGLLISRLEGLPLLTCLFESASAVGTVGVTMGITPQLGQASRAILILLMYCGRVGALTLVFAALSESRGTGSRLPKEKLMVG
ncbi:MAG: Trk family potassium uptake protein [Lawsonibacter sp.]|nr:Trk family potassium uptake protein [Lawsonibacter sp.]